jgi:hypothetical protein
MLKYNIATSDISIIIVCQNILATMILCSTWGMDIYIHTHSISTGYTLKPYIQRHFTLRVTAYINKTIEINIAVNIAEHCLIIPDISGMKTKMYIQKPQGCTCST